MRLVLYGDFNCPYSYLASVRADVLAAAGVATIDWRAVEHDPEITVPTAPPDDDLALMLQREVDEVRGLLREGERLTIRVPPFQPNTAAACSLLAAATGADAHLLRRRIFEALWAHRVDIGTPELLADVTDHASPSADGEARVRRWRQEWHAVERPVVPMLVLPDGYLSRGLGALARLADLAS